MYADDPEVPDEGSVLPDGVSEEQVNDLIRQVMEATNLLGLYAEPTVHIEVVNGQIVLNFLFRIGQVAFTKRIQSPEQDNFDTAFKAIETGDTQDRFDAIKERFSRGKTPQDPPES